MDHKLFGLKKGDIQNIISVLQSEKTVEEAIIFGSRAKGNYSEGSDVDIALKGKNLSLQLIGHISFLLNEETLMPYRFDVINYHSIKSGELMAHIDRVGEIIYSPGISGLDEEMS